MRNTLFAFVLAAVAALSFTAPASAQRYNRADPGCDVSSGGNCGRQRIDWCNTMLRSNRRNPNFIPSAECGGQMQGGGFRQGRSNGGYGGMQSGGHTVHVTRVVHWHRHEEHQEMHVSAPAPQPMAQPTPEDYALARRVYKTLGN